MPQYWMKTSQAASPSVTTTDIWISLIAFVLLYLSLGVADVYLMIHYGRQELEPGAQQGPDGGDADSDLPPPDSSPDSVAEPDEDRVPALIY